jgi:hypothetical protein
MVKQIIGALGLVAAASLLHAPEVRAGAAAGDLFVKFRGQAFTGTVVLNPDAVNEPPSCATPDAPCPGQGTVTIRLTRGSKESTAMFVSGPVANFANGCDGVNGATTLVTPQPALIDLTETRFLGRPWIPTSVAGSLVAPFGVTLDPSQPLVFTDINDPVCTFSDGVWVLSFKGTMQFGTKIQQ